MEIIETIGLTKEFRDFWGRVKARALDNLNLKVNRGEIFGLLGPNGSGKTTTIKLLLGLLFPTAGKIKVLGKSPRHVENKKYIGFLPEETYLYPYQTAEEALLFYGRLFGLKHTICKKRVQDLLEMVGLTKAQKRPLKEYSKGMARRIGIAQALINDPDLIFLDEPTTGLDPIGTKEIKDLILHLKNCGKTIVLCSHLLADVEDICDRIAIVYGGKIRCEGTVAGLLTAPQRTQIVVDNLSDATIQEITQWLQSRQIPASIEKPRERLETYFLRVIQEARLQDTPTSGAEAGKIVADFFKQPNLGSLSEPSNPVLQELLEQKLTHPSPEPIAQPLPTTTNTVLQQLVQPAIEKASIPESSTSIANPSQENIQQEVLNELLAKGKGKK